MTRLRIYSDQVEEIAAAEIEICSVPERYYEDTEEMEYLTYIRFIDLTYGQKPSVQKYVFTGNIEEDDTCLDLKFWQGDGHSTGILADFGWELTWDHIFKI